MKQFKTVLFIIFLLIFNKVNSQENLSFNLLLTYETTFIQIDTTITETRFKLTNSYDNSYFLDVKNLDSLNYQVNLTYRDNIGAKFKILKKELFTLKELNLDCELVFKLKFRYKHKAKHFELLNLKDTLINNINYKRYESNYLKSEKKRLKLKNGKAQYIIEPNTEYHQPIIIHTVLYETWKLHKNIPNGVFKEYIFTNHLGKVINHYKLLKIEKYNLKVNTETPCQPNITFPAMR